MGSGGSSSTVISRIVTARVELEHPLAVKLELNCGHVIMLNGFGHKTPVGGEMDCPLCERHPAPAIGCKARMTRSAYLLAKIMEESAEVGHRAGKALTFGMDDVERGQDDNNYDRLMGEFTDLVAVMEMAGLEPRRLSESRIRAKKEKVETFMKYSAERGILEG
jgi:hypothetical protein